MSVVEMAVVKPQVNACAMTRRNTLFPSSVTDRNRVLRDSNAHLFVDV